MSAATFFEGPEKKVELVVCGDSLRRLPQSAWREVVRAADAHVLSMVSSEACDAYLLSESSLFVFDDHVTMITCGRTRLADGVLALIDLVGVSRIALLIYERKNETYPALQHTSFREDAQRIAKRIPGHALRFGNEHDHHVNVFASSMTFEVDASDTTLEILMHGLPPTVATQFIGAPSEGVAEAAGIAELLGCWGDLSPTRDDARAKDRAFRIDEHSFDPAGYSLNALRGREYFTVHVTPEFEGSYMSIETNLDFRGRLDEMVAQVVDVFRPRCFDVLTFAPTGNATEGFQPETHRVKECVRATVAGYDVSFWHSYSPPKGPRSPKVVGL